MCGVFGFITRNGNGPDLGRLRRIAAQTQRRGHHAFGLAWLDAEGTIHTFKRPGPATANLGDLDACRGATVVIGHCRWATHGSPKNNRNNHPHPAGRGWFVHNGVVVNYRALLRRYRLQPKTECDSEVLGLLMARFAGSIGRRAMQTARAADGRMTMLGIWSNPARLLVVRKDYPLSFGETAGGVYFASLPEDLPGAVMHVSDHYAGVLVSEGARLKHVAYRIDT
jgi:glucosamine 6-phosphate synthetase-like amidotransferase/phosphosugar isomerase protein